jgi:hypothetical protein
MENGLQRMTRLTTGKNIATMRQRCGSDAGADTGGERPRQYPALLL